MARPEIRVTVGNLSKAIMAEVDAFVGEEVERVNRAAERAAKKAAKTLKKTSPKNTGEYAKGWTAKLDHVNPLGTKVYVVHNKNKPGLTHLLERGHVIKSTGKRSRAIPHIKPAEDEAVKEFLEEVTSSL